MKSYSLAITLFFLSLPILVFSQDREQKGVSLLNNEFTISYSNFPQSRLRLSIFPNLNYPVSILIGRNRPYTLETGFNFRNKGLITKDTVVHKYRSLSLGIPVKFSLPAKKPFLFVGIELDYELFFKEKRIDGSNKVKSNSFISKKVNNFQPGFTAEVILNKDWRIKGSYYLKSYLNRDFKEVINNNEIMPFSKSSNIFYVSVVGGLFFVTTRPTIIRLFN